MKQIKTAIRKTIKMVVGEETFNKIWFKRSHGYSLNLNNPLTFSEKIHWVKKHADLEKYAKYVDKYEVREFVEKTIGKDLLIPLIGVYKSSMEIEFSELPKSFIVKATHGSGWNRIVKDKNKINIEKVRDEINGWIKASFYKIYGERNYKPLIGRVVIEELIIDPSGDLKDYKFFCYNGEPLFIQVDGDRFSQHKRDMYDADWNRLPVKCEYENFETPVNEPVMLTQMLEIAKKLSAEFPFVRVDLYCAAESKIYFGELTFTPGNGLDRFTPIEFDKVFGAPLQINKYSEVKEGVYGSSPFEYTS